jgi:Lon protease-like protein
MALKTVQASSNLPRTGVCNFSLPLPWYKPKLRPADSRISTKNHQKSSTTSALKCRANLHGCVDEVVQFNKDRTTEIPVVLCPSVAFPGATLQLQAFQFRYRIMVQTLLQEGLNFGVVYSGNKHDGGMADVGCLVQVIECERLIDGRFFLTCVAGDRFRVVEVVRTKPYVVATVQVLNDQQVCSEPPQQSDMGSLMQQVEQHLTNVVALSEKVNRALTGDHQYQAVQLSNLHYSAASFSFLVARLFIDDRLEQQTLLQVDDVAQRLAREGMYLERRSKYLAAFAAIKDAFQHGLFCNEK